MSRIIGADEAAHILGVCKATVTRGVASGRIPSLGRLNGHPNGPHLFDASVVEQIAEHRQAVAS